MGRYYKVIILFLLLNSYYSFSQTICDTAAPLCSNENLTGNPPSGNPGGTINGGCQMLQAEDVTWYVVRIQSGTTFTFVIDPDGPDDYDFAVWKNPNCNNLGVADRASYAATPPYTTGLSMTANDTCETAGGNGFVKYLDVQPGDIILIAIDKYDNDADGFTLIFDSGSDSELDCTILGDSYGKCDIDGNQQETFVASEFLPDLNTDFPGSVFKFYYTKTDAESGTGLQISFPHTVNVAGNPNLIFARVENVSGGFIRAVQISLYVNPLPSLTTTSVNLPPVCDRDGDEKAEFDLTLAEPDLVADPSLYTFKYYVDENDANAGSGNFINPSNAYLSGNTTLYVRVESGALDGNEDGCFSVGQINLAIIEADVPTFNLQDEYCVDQIPTLSNISLNSINGSWSPSTIEVNNNEPQTYVFTPNASECAENFEIEITVVDEIMPQFSLENNYCLGVIPPDLLEMSENEIEGIWFPSTINTTTPNITTYKFTPNDPDCVADFEIEIEVAASFQLNNSLSVELCDDNFDGVYEYDLTLLNSQLINSTEDLLFSFYKSLQDYNNGIVIPESQLNNYEINLSETLLVEAKKEDGCRSGYVEVRFIQGQSIPLISGPYEIPICQGESVNLTLTENTLYTSETGVDFTYYDSRENAETQTGAISDITNYASAEIGSSLFVRIDKEDGSKCSEIVQVEFTAGQEVQYNPGPYSPITYCKDEIINITDYTSGIANESDVLLSYYLTEQDAENGLNPIPDETAFAADGNGTIFIKLEKSNRCAVIVPLQYELLPMPQILGDLSSELEICEGKETIELSVSSDDPNAVFEWSWGNNQTQSGSTISITETGTYKLTVIGSNGCRNEKEFTVETGGEPTITAIESGSDFVIVSAEPGDGGTIEYSLNGILWQDSPRFDNLVRGEIYTIYVRENGCIIKTYQTSILDVPSFLSPNGDGINDIWTIRGIEITPNATIKIFNRYGKMFVDTNFEGDYLWDGKYGGRSVASGEYWYIIDIPSDGVSAARKFIGFVAVRN